jgi:hypothetical protein
MKLTQIPTKELDKYRGLLTQSQANSLTGQMYQPDSYFNPIKDINDNWIISPEEIAYCTNITFMWVKDLEMIPYSPKPVDPMILPE